MSSQRRRSRRCHTKLPSPLRPSTARARRNGSLRQKRWHVARRTPRRSALLSIASDLNATSRARHADGLAPTAQLVVMRSAFTGALVERFTTARRAKCGAYDCTPTWTPSSMSRRNSPPKKARSLRPKVRRSARWHCIMQQRGFANASSAIGVAVSNRLVAAHESDPGSNSAPCAARALVQQPMRLRASAALSSRRARRPGPERRPRTEGHHRATRGRPRVESYGRHRDGAA